MPFSLLLYSIDLFIFLRDLVGLSNESLTLLASNLRFNIPIGNISNCEQIVEFISIPMTPIFILPIIEDSRI